MELSLYRSLLPDLPQRLKPNTQTGGKGMELIPAGSCSARRRMRSAQVYSLIAILLSIPVMLFIAYYVTESQNIRYSSLERVLADQLHEVEKGIENDFEQAMSISGKRAFLAATNHVIKEGEPLDDAAMRMEELMANGTLYGEYVFVMENNTIQDWIDKIEALELGFNVDLSYSNPVVTNLDGLDTKLTAVLDINVSDYSDIGKISKRLVKEATISLKGIEDPIFPVNTLGFVSRSIAAYPYPYHAIKMASGSGYDSCSGNVTFDPEDPDKADKILVIHDATGITGFAGVVGETAGIPAVTCHLVGATGAVDSVNKTVQWSGYDEICIDSDSGGAWSLPIYEAIEYGYYTPFETGGGPSMMERLEENLTGVDMGMETFVNLVALQERHLDVKTGQVSIAYLYFSEQAINGQAVRGLQDWFRVDAANAARYNLTELM
jgi:hypothetical protein